MLLSIISLGTGLLGALIGATVALRTKKMDLAAKVDDRRTESLRQGYDLVLAATDLTWHYQCHLRLHAAGWDLPGNWKTDWPKMRNRIDAAMTTGVDLLKQYSSQYDNVAIVLNWAWQVTRDGYTLRMMESRPDDYLEVRDNLILCARTDSRMSAPIKRRHWQTFFKSNRPQDMGDLDASGRLSRVQALMSAGSAEGFVLQDAGDTDEDNVVLALIKGIREAPKLFVPSLTITENRIQEWIRRDVIQLQLFCTTGEDTCSDKAQLRLEEEQEDADE